MTDVIEMQAPQIQPAAAKKRSPKWLYSLGAMAACLALVFTSLSWMGQTPYASVYMTINPEVRIDVNRSDRVVGLEGGNRDGADLIEGYKYRRKELDTVMDELVELAIRDGYLHEGGKVTLTLASEDDRWEVTHSDRLEQHLRETLDETLSVTIVVQPRSETTLEPAPSEPQPSQSQPPQQTEKSIQVVIPMEPENSEIRADSRPSAQS